MSTASNRRLWRAAGWLAIAHVVLLFVGAALLNALELGDKASVASDALVTSSLAKSYAGGLAQFVGFLVFLVLAMLLPGCCGATGRCRPGCRRASPPARSRMSR